MSWSTFLYAYHQLHGGQFLGGEQEDSLLILTHKGQPLAVEPYTAPGRYGGTYIRSRIPVTLERPFHLTIGAESNLSLGVNAAKRALSALPNVGSLTAGDYGCPEITRNRYIRTDSPPFAKLVLSSPDLRAALLSSPKEKLTVSPGPGEGGLHLVTVTTDSTVPASLGLEGGGWYLGPVRDDSSLCASQEGEYISQRMETGFFPRMDGFLNLTRAFRDALTAWPMPLPEG